ncbi:YodC family protein [Sinorhizobium fredii]|uniref:YodC family protein n=1 Tax=Rhizobium fredii TaxID=380 RepID=UPI0004AF91BD|nr:DUF2158 domain-containing protein [Sinorhizobium fredii]
MAYKIGDIVQLKSGGPKMTVTEISPNDHVWTSWFAGAKNEKARFHIETLQVAKDEPKK